MTRQHLFVPSKLEYAQGKRPDVDCILCEVAARGDRVARLEVARSGGFVISANLYPYNPGHLMIFPEEHIEDPSLFSAEQVVTLHRLQGIAIECIASVYGARGFNVGFNFGTASGASLAHFHLHVVPRYPNEVGFIDVIGGARIMVEDPNVTCRKVADWINSRLTAEEVDNK